MLLRANRSPCDLRLLLPLMAAMFGATPAVVFCAVPAAWAQDAPGPAAAIPSTADCEAYGSAENGWTVAEAWVWGRICAGVTADLDDFVTRGLGENRNLSARFIETILLKQPFRDATPLHGVDIRHAVVTEPLTLGDVVLKRQVAFSASEFSDSVRLARLQTDSGLDFSGSQFARGLDITNVSLKGNLDLEKTLFLRSPDTRRMLQEPNSLSLADADIGGKIMASGSDIEIKADFTRLHLRGKLTMEYCSELTDLDLSWAKIGSTVSLKGSHLRGDLTVVGAEIGGSFELSGAVLDGGLTMDGTHFGDRLGLGGAQIQNQTALARIQVAGPLSLAEAHVSGDLLLNGAHIGDDLSLAGTRVDGVSQLKNLQVSGSLSTRATVLAVASSIFKSDIDLLGASVGGDVEFSSAVVKGAMELQNAVIGRNLRLDGVPRQSGSFGPVDASGARISGGLFLQRASFGGALRFEGAQIGQDVTISEADFSAGAPLNLIGARIAGDLTFQVADLGGPLWMQASQIGQDLNIGEGTSFGSDVDMRHSRIGGALKISSSSFAGSLDMQSIQVGDSLEIGVPRQAGGRVQSAALAAAKPVVAASGATLAKAPPPPSPAPSMDAEEKPMARRIPTVAMSSDLSHPAVEPLQLAAVQSEEGSREAPRPGGAEYRADAGGETSATIFNGSVNLTFAQIGRDLAINPPAHFKSDVDLKRSHVASEVDIRQTSFDFGIDMQAIQVGESLLLHDQARFDEKVDLSFARVADNLQLTGGIFTSVDLTGASIGAELRLGAAQAAPGAGDPSWNQPRTLILRNVKAGTLQDLPWSTSWPASVDLEGFSYDRLGGASTSSDDLGRHSADDFERWLKLGQTRQAGAGPAVDRNSDFSPQPYVELAAVLRAAGFQDKADDILFKGRLAEMANAPWYRQIFLALEWAVTGFGLRPWQAGLWVMALVALGVFMTYQDHGPHFRRFNRVDRLVYSLDMLIPVIHLRHVNHEFEPRSALPRYYFYAHRLAGFVLASLLIASLTNGAVELH